MRQRVEIYRAALLGIITLAVADDAIADYFPGTPMPDTPGCIVTSCEPIFDGYRHGQRCHWRCPRQHFSNRPRYAAPRSPEWRRVDPNSRRYDDAPRYGAPSYVPIAFADGDATIPLAVLGLITLGILAAISRHFESLAAARATDNDLEFTTETVAARERLDAAARQADEIMARYRAAMKGQGQEGGPR